MSKRRVTGSLIVALSLTLGIFILVSCASNGGPVGTTSTQSPTTKPIQPSSVSTEQPVAPGSGAQASASDIPDTQVFVTYSSASGSYALDVPEGWARTTNTAEVTFISTLNGLQVTITNAATAPTADSVRTTQVVTLEQTGRAVRDVKVQDVQLPNGAAVLITYTSNSDPNAVTNKQVRLENNSYLFFKNGKLATLTLWAPVGADNVDQWARMSRSFKWV